MYCIRLYLFIFFFVLLSGSVLYSQIPLIERYTSEDVPPVSSVFFIHQDRQGYMYISTGGSTYLYDGKTWELIKGLNSVRSGINDNDGTVLLGLDDGMGYLEILPDGTRKYIPLTDQLTDDEKKCPLYGIFTKQMKVYFFAASTMYSIFRK